MDEIVHQEPSIGNLDKDTNMTLGFSEEDDIKEDTFVLY
jgi:hypothetical protein